MTTRDIGNWANYDGTPSVEFSVSFAIRGGDREWLETLTESGAFTRIVDDYRQAINEALPEAITLCGDMFIAECDMRGNLLVDDDEPTISDVLRDVDLFAIVERHDPTIN